MYYAKSYIFALNHDGSVGVAPRRHVENWAALRSIDVFTTEHVVTILRHFAGTGLQYMMMITKIEI